GYALHPLIAGVLVRRVGRCSFFFQAEDGIRDFHVTGVQTCALPISSPRAEGTCRAATCTGCRTSWTGSSERSNEGERRKRREPRSEERRVGKECRGRRCG